MDINIIKKRLARERIGILGENTEYTRYSVTIPIVNVGEENHVLFQVRARHLRNQPGEISFPGGKIEEGEGSLNAAIRETSEELGIKNEDIEVIGRTDILITQHNKIIYPYVGYIKDINKINPSRDEVDHVFCVPLKFFLENEPEARGIKLISEIEEEFPYLDFEKKVTYRLLPGRSKIYFYKYDDYIIWGLTAKILYHFIGLIKE
ncbi:NUDIX hydrolase [Fonticella tunisiensis]|uniref:NUDIX domain-containing protein n=1 Tax=Fonticella tunisiensis TaxID=1096341 RepID=A0A4R7KQK8_9CLOT|nr:CoA pyrophosphatase [Fonticella tunisiensis]TDT60974.1 NUDIX domain-containing protein [Fonticella tunisiensis]